MGIWTPGETEFIMSVVPCKRTGTKYANIQVPVQNKLGNPKYVKFVIRSNKVTLERSDKKRPRKDSTG